MRKRTRQVFESLHRLTGELGYTPVMRQIAEDIVPEGKSSLAIISDVFYCLQELVLLGLVEQMRTPPTGMYVPLKDVAYVDWEKLKGGDDAENDCSIHERDSLRISG